MGGAWGVQSEEDMALERAVCFTQWGDADGLTWLEKERGALVS